MSDKKKAAVYPYDAGFAPFLRHRELIEEYDIIGAAAPSGFGLSGKDAGTADGGYALGLIVSESIETFFDICDTVIFVQSKTPVNFDAVLLPELLKSVNAGKNIVFNIDLHEKVLQQVEALSKSTDCKFEYKKSKPLSPVKIHLERIYNINVPIVFVSGIGQKNQKFEIQLALREEFMRQGYKVSQIGSRSCCEMLGFHSFPEFMLSDGINETTKILLFNYFVKDIELKETPDIMIIGIPGGIMPFNNSYTNKFGILAFEVSRAICPDAVVFSTPYEKHDADYFRSLCAAMPYRLGSEVTCFNIATSRIDWDTSMEKFEDCYLTLDWEFVDSKKESIAKTSDVPLFNIFNKDDSKAMAELIIDRLAQNVEIEAF